VGFAILRFIDLGWGVSGTAAKLSSSRLKSAAVKKYFVPFRRYVGPPEKWGTDFIWAMRFFLPIEPFSRASTWASDKISFSGSVIDFPLWCRVDKGAAFEATIDTELRNLLVA
jgi:hypothetical protein